MKKNLKCKTALVLAALFIIGCIIPTTKVKAGDYGFKSVGYFYYETGDIDDIDVTKITHLNYSFGLIYHDEKLNEQNVPNDPEKLHTIYLPEKVKSDLEQIDKLKAKNPNLKVLLSVGGWGCRGFSNMASSEETRQKFANSALDIVNRYGLDGIDLDWEYPVNGGWGVIDSKPEDKQNFTKLLSTMRNTLADESLLTIAAAANPAFINSWTEFDEIVKYLDYINIMAYDLAYGTQYHNSNLENSEEWKTDYAGDKFSIKYIVNNYLNTGISPKKLNLGVAFFGRVPKRALEPGMDWDSGEVASNPYFTDYELGIFNSYGFDIKKDTYIKFNDISKTLLKDDRFTEKWDDIAKVPYLTLKNEKGEEVFAVSYENEKSVKIKAQYIRDMGLGGAMFWDYSGDYNNTLATTLSEALGIEGENPYYEWECGWN